MENDILPSKRLSGIKPSDMRKLFEIAKIYRAQGREIIDFGLGDINIPLSKHVIKGINDALNSGKNKYGSNAGELPLRSKLADISNLYHDTRLTFENVLVTCGSLEGLYDIAMAYINPGDEVLIVEPEFPYFGYQVLLAGGIPIPISLTKNTDFMVTPEMVLDKITPKTKALLINYPNNPTGAIIEKKYFEKIVNICEEHNIILISDEAYEKMVYDGLSHPSALDYNYANTLVVNSASKSLCMTGLRVGYTISNSIALLKPVMQVHQYNTAHASINNQYGLLNGLNHYEEIIDNSLSVLQKRRDLIYDSWKNIPGVLFPKPKATFYLYPNVKNTGMNSTKFCDFALDNGIVLTPGTAFCFDNSNDGGNFHVRVAYGMVNENEIMKASELLQDALSSII